MNYKTLFLAALGGALEIYDFIIFVFAKAISQSSFLLTGLSGSVCCRPCVSLRWHTGCPLGGLLMAHWADRYGRKRAFTLSITMMALPCFVIGLMPTYAEAGYVAPALLLVLRRYRGLRSGAGSQRLGVCRRACAARSSGVEFRILQAG